MLQATPENQFTPTTLPIEVIRMYEVTDFLKYSKNTYLAREADGLMPPPISLGGSSKGYLKHEIQAVLNYLIVGKSDDEIRALVKSLVAQRQQLVA